MAINSFLVMISILAGTPFSYFRGFIVTLVPHSIVVGFTIGIAIVIAFSQIGNVLGITHPLGYNITEQLPKIIIHFNDMPCEPDLANFYQ